jgi:putative membrane protein (TIGR04086 family)
VAGLSERVEWPAVRAGALAGVCIALPLAILAQLVVGDDNDSVPLLGWVLYLAVLFSLVFTGWVASRQAGETPYATGAVAALATFVAVQAIGVISVSIRGDGISVPSIVFNALLAYGCGLLGAAIVVKQRNLGMQ